MAGYSNKPLSEKLGIKPSFRMFALHYPQNYFDLLGVQSSSFKRSLSGEFDFIHIFTTSRKNLLEAFLKVKGHIKKDGAVWVSWPKQSSPIKIDLNENIVREVGMNNGLVDVKVVAVDNNWSALKFVYRLKDRK